MSEVWKVSGASGLVAEFNDAQVLAPSDVHVATRLLQLGRQGDESVALAVALAVRGPRFGHVRVDLLDAPETVTADTEDRPPGSLPWPEPQPWLEAIRSSPLVSVGLDGPSDRPLRLIGTALYLDRYWRDEVEVAVGLARRVAVADPRVDLALLADGLDRLFGVATGSRSGVADDQRRAAETAVRRRLAVIAGGPGTGKTTTVAKIMALLFDQANAAGARQPMVAMSAPTGKAAARMQDAVRAAAAELNLADSVRSSLEEAQALTLHRLLGRRPATSSRFRHERYNLLPHDVVIVDEMSMVPLSLMARLTEAVRPDARLILVGDPEQLASVEAGAVLADIVDQRADGPVRDPSEQDGGSPNPLAGSIVFLRANYRFSGTLASVADAVRSGDADATIRSLASPGDDRVRWINTDADAFDLYGRPTPGVLAPVREAVVGAARSLLAAAESTQESTAAVAALESLGRFRVLCAHRRGGAGVSAWTDLLESWIAADVEGMTPQGPWYVGRPVMVTSNDYTLRLFNGDTGVVVARPEGGVSVVFDQSGRPATFSPSRLSGLETVFAMTVHKAQGSEFDDVVLVLPPSSSPILTRELLYTALTRARRSLLVVSGEESLRSAVKRRVARASGLADRLQEAKAGTAELERLT